MLPTDSVPQMKISVNKMKLEVKAKLKDMEYMMKPIAPFFSEKIRTLRQEAKYLQGNLMNLRIKKVRVQKNLGR